MDSRELPAPPAAALHRLRSTFAALSCRSYRLYFIGQTVSLTGSWMQVVAQGWLVWGLAHDSLLVGLVSAAAYAPTLLFWPLAGAAADRLDKRRLLLATQSAALLLSLTLGTLTLLPDLAVWKVLLVAIGFGITNAFDMPTRDAFVAEIVDRPLLPNAISLNATIFGSARVIGPALASAVVTRTRVGIPACCFLNALSYLVMIAALAAIRFRRPFRAGHASVVRAVFEGLGFAVRAPLIGGLILLVTVSGTFGWSVPVILPVFSDTVLHRGPRGFALVSMSIGIGALAGSIALAGVSHVRHRFGLLLCGLSLWALSLGLLSRTSLLLPAVVAAASAGVGMVAFMTMSNVLIQTTVPDALRGRITSLWSLVFAVSELLAGLFAGSVAAAIGARGAVLAAAAAMASLAIAALLVVGRCRPAPGDGLVVRGQDDLVTGPHRPHQLA